MTFLDTKSDAPVFNNGSPSREAKPFLKWAGGKKQLIAQYAPLFPEKFTRYCEPFIGGGAIFFYLWNSRKLPAKCCLFDSNEELINVYQVVRDAIDDLIRLLRVHRKNHNKDYYYKIRNLDRENTALNPVEKAARMIYLNKTCFNGLYRVNSNGYFNVPMGSYRNPRIFDEKQLRLVSRALKKVNLEVRDFRTIVDFAREKDFFYFDPPYHPVSATSSFTRYSANDFTETDQKDLAGVFDALTKKGCYCLLSNSHTPFILNLYQNFTIKLIDASRRINSDGEKRGSIKEIVVLNYKIK